MDISGIDSLIFSCVNVRQVKEKIKKMAMQMSVKDRQAAIAYCNERVEHYIAEGKKIVRDVGNQIFLLDDEERDALDEMDVKAIKMNAAMQGFDFPLGIFDSKKGCNRMFSVEEFVMNQDGRREMAEKVAAIAFEMPGNKRKEYIDECNAMIEKVKREMDIIREPYKNQDIIDCPKEINNSLAELSDIIGRIGVLRKAMIFPFMYLNKL